MLFGEVVLSWFKTTGWLLRNCPHAGMMIKAWVISSNTKYTRISLFFERVRILRYKRSKQIKRQASSTRVPPPKNCPGLISLTTTILAQNDSHLSAQNQDTCERKTPKEQKNWNLDMNEVVCSECCWQRSFNHPRHSSGKSPLGKSIWTTSASCPIITASSLGSSTTKLWR